MANNDKKDHKADSKATESTTATATSTTEKLGEAIKKIISSGSPAEISKEIIASMLAQVLKAKDDITLKVSNEMIGLVQKIDFVKEFSKFTENHKFKISAEIEIIKKDISPKDSSPKE